MSLFVLGSDRRELTPLRKDFFPVKPEKTRNPPEAASRRRFGGMVSIDSAKSWRFLMELPKGFIPDPYKPAWDALNDFDFSTRYKVVVLMQIRDSLELLNGNIVKAAHIIRVALDQKASPSPRVSPDDIRDQLGILPAGKEA